MLQALGYSSLDAFVQAVVPSDILDETAPQAVMPAGVGEAAALAELREIADANQLRRSLIGLGYHDTVTPALIWKTPPGTRPIPPTKPRSPRVDWRHSSISRP
jgi:glycine dehydrogenase